MDLKYSDQSSLYFDQIPELDIGKIPDTDILPNVNIPPNAANDVNNCDVCKCYLYKPHLYKSNYYDEKGIVTYYKTCTMSCMYKIIKKCSECNTYVSSYTPFEIIAGNVKIITALCSKKCRIKFYGLNKEKETIKGMVILGVNPLLCDILSSSKLRTKPTTQSNWDY
jgi:hypothetical protein